jgi:hypothetical protein
MVGSFQYDPRFDVVSTGLTTSKPAVKAKEPEKVAKISDTDKYAASSGTAQFPDSVGATDLVLGWSGAGAQPTWDFLTDINTVSAFSNYYQNSAKTVAPPKKLTTSAEATQTIIDTSNSAEKLSAKVTTPKNKTLSEEQAVNEILKTYDRVDKIKEQEQKIAQGKKPLSPQQQAERDKNADRLGKQYADALAAQLESEILTAMSEFMPSKGNIGKGGAPSAASAEIAPIISAYTSAINSLVSAGLKNGMSPNDLQAKINGLMATAKTEIAKAVENMSTKEKQNQKYEELMAALDLKLTESDGPGNMTTADRQLTAIHMQADREQKMAMLRKHDGMNNPDAEKTAKESSYGTSLDTNV